ncbi:MAG: hypothetical protein JSS61_06510 [Verrucomicrobia bacterium]|nr:hypothetical protein [Verrucomicrobiota bacterium]
MKSVNKKLNKRKASKVTLKSHAKHGHAGQHAEVKEATDGISDVRPEGIKFHQQY